MSTLLTIRNKLEKELEEATKCLHDCVGLFTCMNTRDKNFYYDLDIKLSKYKTQVRDLREQITAIDEAIKNENKLDSINNDIVDRIKTELICLKVYIDDLKKCENACSPLKEYYKEQVHIYEERISVLNDLKNAYKTIDSGNVSSTKDDIKMKFYIEETGSTIEALRPKCNLDFDQVSEYLVYFKDTVAFEKYQTVHKLNEKTFYVIDQEHFKN